MKASHQRARISPRKTRLVADMLRPRVKWIKEDGRRRKIYVPVGVEEAKNILDFSDKRAAVYVAKVLRSAEANAMDPNGPYRVADSSSLVVQRIQVNEGPRWKVLFPRPRGVGATMTRPTCHIEVELAEAAPAAPVAPRSTKRKERQQEPKKAGLTKEEPVPAAPEGT